MKSPRYPHVLGLLQTPHSSLLHHTDKLLCGLNNNENFSQKRKLNLIAELAITIIVKEGENDICEVVGELDMSNSPAWPESGWPEIMERGKPGNMLHSLAVNGSSGHMVEGQGCVNVVDRVKNL